MTVRCDLAGKVVAVTGASRGLGAVAARAFAQAGAQVALLGRTEQHLEEQAAYIGSSALPIVADVGRPEDVRRAFALIDEKFGRLDVLVNNAATMAHALIQEATDEDISSIVGSNFLGPIYTTRAAIPAMRRVGSGHILNISTEGTMFPEAPYLGLYVATKTGLDMFSRVSYEELKPLGIRVTLIVPGAMQPRDPGGVSGPTWDRSPTRGQNRECAGGEWPSRPTSRWKSCILRRRRRCDVICHLCSAQLRDRCDPC